MDKVLTEKGLFRLIANMRNEYAAYTVCATPGDVNAKTITLPMPLKLRPGKAVRICVKFTNGHTALSDKGDGNIVLADNPTLIITNCKVYIEGTWVDAPAIPITVEGALAGENFVNAGATHEFLVTCDSAEDLTATIIYRGSNSNGDYVKYRDGKIVQ